MINLLKTKIRHHMKSRKQLKKEIKKSFNILYQEIFFYDVFVVNAEVEKSKAILTEMLNRENDLLKRISFYEGKEVKGRVKMYFSKLREDFHKHLAEFENKIGELVRQ